MELSDNPHPVGTKEHHRWVVDVYIPSLTDDQIEQHRKRAGAEAIGKKLIDDTRRPSGGTTFQKLLDQETQKMKADLVLKMLDERRRRAH